MCVSGCILGLQKTMKKYELFVFTSGFLQTVFATQLRKCATSKIQAQTGIWKFKQIAIEVEPKDTHIFCDNGISLFVF